VHALMRLAGQARQVAGLPDELPAVVGVTAPKVDADPPDDLEVATEPSSVLAFTTEAFQIGSPRPPSATLDEPTLEVLLGSPLSVVKDEGEGQSTPASHREESSPALVTMGYQVGSGLSAIREESEDHQSYGSPTAHREESSPALVTMGYQVESAPSASAPSAVIREQSEGQESQGSQQIPMRQLLSKQQIPIDHSEEPSPTLATEGHQVESAPSDVRQQSEGQESQASEFVPTVYREKLPAPHLVPTIYRGDLVPEPKRLARPQDSYDFEESETELAI